MEGILYDSPENVFPRGSIIPAFTRGRNLGEVIAPTKPVRERRERFRGAAFPAPPGSACSTRKPFRRSGASQVEETAKFGR